MTPQTTTAPQGPAAAGLWLPLITPFRDGALDLPSLRRLVAHYCAAPLDGLILAATTGEGLTLDDDEVETLVATAAEAAAGRLPLYLGLAGSDTRRLAARLAATRTWPLDGYLVTCPYYSRPSQTGLYQHFAALAGASERPLLIYNIPYRTGVNLANDTLLELAALPTVVGVKDCCADPAQTWDLLCRKPADFALLTGEDAMYFNTLAQGGEGAVLATAHVRTAEYAALRDHLLTGRQREALAIWQPLSEVARLLFAEPSPAALKHWLWRDGLIDSPELRLPMVPVSDGLAARVDAAAAAARQPVAALSAGG